MTAVAATSWQPSYPMRAVERPLSAMQAWLIAAMAFCIAAMNGSPLSWSSLPQVVAISGLLILQRNPAAIVRAAFSSPLRGFTLAFLGFAACNVMAAIVSGEPEAFGQALLRSVAPLLPFFALAGVSIQARHVPVIFGGFVAGIGVLLVRATLAFYSEWGIPDLNTLLWARYDVVRMSGYMTASLGNLSQFGLYIALFAPFLIALLAYFKVSRLFTWVTAIVLALALLNAVVSGSRTAIVLMLPIAALIFARRGPVALIVLGGILAFMAIIGVVYGIDPVSQTDLINRFIPSEGATGYDASAVERVDSIILGWQLFTENPLFGVGPGQSYRYIPYAIPHQSIVHMLLELGVVGGLIFLVISLLTITQATLAVLAPDSDGRLYWRAAWLIGPAAYFLFGLLAGIAFTMSIALVWIGAVYMMVPLAYARIVENTSS